MTLSNDIFNLKILKKKKNHLTILFNYGTTLQSIEKSITIKISKILIISNIIDQWKISNDYSFGQLYYIILKLFILFAFSLCSVICQESF